MKRGRKPGTPRSPGTGRKPGTPNRRTVELQEAIEAAGIDWQGTDNPVVRLLLIGTGRVLVPAEGPEGPVKDGNGKLLMVEPPLPIQSKCLAEAAQYLFPKRKSVEHTGSNGNPIEHTYDFGKTGTRELAAIVAALRAARGERPG